MKNIGIYLLLFVYAVIASLTILFFDGTGDAGDSVHHYLFAKYAYAHPQLFFDHWAKPVFVLLASPFAQFGFIGVKIFNAIVFGFTIFFTFQIAEALQLKNAILTAIISICSPLFYALTFSGLTEPLFALFISIGVYAILKQKYIAASIIISFLPFIRSEGLVIIGVFGIYFLFKQQWKALPLLLFGHIIYSFAGYFVYHDLLWVFNKIPYAHLSSTYGSGKLFHFVEQLIYVIGIPIYVLFWLGIISIVWTSIKKNESIELQILIFFGFLSFFIAHTLFWYWGIFNSMGLKRVLIGVVPMISIISLKGFNFLTETFFENKKIPRLSIQVLLIGYVFIFPFTSNPAAINWKKDLMLSDDQQAATKAIKFISQNIGENHRFVYAHPYLGEVLGIDPFDSQKRLDLTTDFINNTKPGDVIIWENGFSVVENKVTKESLDNKPELISLYDSTINTEGREINYSVYIRK